MVVALGPGKFYGSSLPRPRIYTDVKFNNERVDPPLPILDPLHSWAQEAHWSMGGLCVTRHQGRIEGSVKKLRAEREDFFKKGRQNRADHRHRIAQISSKESARLGTRRYASPSSPPAPVAIKRRRFIGLVDEDDDEDERDTEGGGDEGKGNDDDEVFGVRIRRRSARKLWDDFDRAAAQSGSPVKGSSCGSEAVGIASGTRTSPRLVKSMSS